MDFTNSRDGRRSMTLTLEEANRVLQGTLAKAKQLNIKVSAAVCDSGGRLVAFARMDNAIWASVYGSQGKAIASAAFGRTSGEMQARADQPTPRGIAAAEGGHMIMGQGVLKRRVFAQQRRRPLRPNAASARQPVRRIAAQGDEIRHLPRLDAVALAHLRRADARHLAGPHRVQDHRPVGSELVRIAVA